MTYDFGGMPFTPEMNSFEAEIGGNQGLVPRGDLQDGAIISDAGGDPSSSGCSIPDARDQEFFGQRQGGTNDIQTMKLEQTKSGAECPVLWGQPVLASIHRIEVSGWAAAHRRPCCKAAYGRIVLFIFGLPGPRSLAVGNPPKDHSPRCLS